MDSDMELSGSISQDFTMASGAWAGYSIHSRLFHFTLKSPVLPFFIMLALSCCFSPMSPLHTASV